MKLYLVREYRFHYWNIYEKQLLDFFLIEQELKSFEVKIKEEKPFVFSVMDFKRYLSFKTALFHTFYRRRFEWIFGPREKCE